MKPLYLEMEGPRGATVPDQTFDLLQDFLQPDTTLTMEKTAQSILTILGEQVPHSDEVWSFGETCIEVAEQIPYYHLSQLKLVDLLEHLGSFMKLGGVRMGQFNRYQRLGESLRESYTYPDPEYPEKWVNFHAFAANIYERRIFSTDPTWAIWAQRDAHEGDARIPKEESGIVRGAYVMAAAQWILWYGQSLFKQVLCPGDISETDLQHWMPGPLYDGKASLSLHRWHFWRDRFEAVATGAADKKRGKGVSQECKTMAMKAAKLMDALEQNMTV